LAAPLGRWREEPVTGSYCQGEKKASFPTKAVTDESDFMRQIKEKVGKFRTEEDIERKLRKEYRSFRPSYDRSDTHEWEYYDS
jgi:hypothetical protein